MENGEYELGVVIEKEVTIDLPKAMQPDGSAPNGGENASDDQ